MHIISFDIGLRHLACCELKQDSFDKFTIEHWSVDSCIPDDVNVNATSLETLVPAQTHFVHELLQSFSKPDMFVIESQPMGHGRSFGGTSMGGSPRNLKTKVLSHILQGLILLQFGKDISIHFISPTLKMKDCTLPFRERTYRDNKKYAIEKTLQLLDNYSIENRPRFLECASKKDDLADSFLQAQTVCKCIENKSLVLKCPEFELKKTKETKTKEKKTKETKLKEEKSKKTTRKTDEKPAKRARTMKNAKKDAAKMADLDDE